MRIGALFAVLALLLCAIVARADLPIVIKDSEAIQYVGKEVEVHGQVVSVTTSPLGTTFINFGGEYPNQRFAGFIAAGSPVATDQRLTMIQGRTISIIGTILLRNGKPEIEIVSADQITGLESQTSGEACPFPLAVEPTRHRNSARETIDAQLITQPLRNFSIAANSSACGLAFLASHMLRIPADIPMRDAIA